MIGFLWNPTDEFRWTIKRANRIVAISYRSYKTSFRALRAARRFIGAVKAAKSILIED